MARITTVIYSVVIVSAVAGLLGLFLSGIASENTDASNYNNETIAAYNKMAELSHQAETIKANVTAIKEKQNALDIIGGFFSNAYQSVVTTAKGVDTVDEISNQAAADAHLGRPGSIVKTMVVVLLILAVFVGVIIRVLVKPGGEHDL